MGGKGPRLTTQLAIAGRCLVYLPADDCRPGLPAGWKTASGSRLREPVRGARVGRERDVIARTAAEGADEQALGARTPLPAAPVGLGEAPGRGLQRAGAGVRRGGAGAARGARTAWGRRRAPWSWMTPVCRGELVNYLRAIAPELAGMVELDEGGGLFERFGLEKEIDKALQRRVDLPSGGYIVIDHTEAMTVVDVNTGSYTGRRSWKTPS